MTIPTTTDTITIPHSREAEEALLSAVLVNPEVFPEVRDVSPEAFYLQRNRWVWEACLRLAQRGQPLDTILLTQELDDMGQLGELGGPAYLTTLLGAGGYSFNAEGYALVVRSFHLRRRLLSAANETARLAYDLNTDPLEALTQSIKAVRRAGEFLATEDSRTLKELLTELYDQAVERAKTGVARAATRIATEWAGINEFLGGGLAPGKLYIVAGRPGDGKSTWLTNAAYHAGLNGKRVGLFSLEMEQLEVTARIMAAQTGLNATLLTDGILKASEDWDTFVQGLEAAEVAQLHILYTPRLTPEGLRARAHRLQAAHGLDLLVVDYLQLMKGDARLANRQEEVAAISRELKILAGELRGPVIAAAQLNRAVEQRENREPQLSDLRESGAIENDADVVRFLYRPDRDEDDSVAKFAKNRSGKTGKQDLHFEAAQYRFTE